MITLGVIFGILAILTGYLIALYNGLVDLKHGTSKAWANIDVLLKQRHDELPKLIETCRQYMKHESSVLETVIKARSASQSARVSGDMAAIGAAETTMRGGMMNLFAVAEDYPDLKANDSFNNLQSRISEIEESISDRRELYNESVNNNNVRIEQFPDVLIANAFGFKGFELLEFSDEEKEDVSVKDLFG